MTMQFAWAATLALALQVPSGPGAIVTPAIVAEKAYQRDHQIVLRVDGLAKDARVKWVVRDDSSRRPDVLVLSEDGASIAVWAPPGKYSALAVICCPSPQIAFWDLEVDFDVVEKLPEPAPPGPQPRPPTPPEADDVKGLVSGVAKQLNLGKETRSVLEKTFAENAELTKGSASYDQARLMEITVSNASYSLGLNEFLKAKPVFTALKKEIERQQALGKLKNESKDEWFRLWAAAAAGIKE